MKPCLPLTLLLALGGTAAPAWAQLAVSFTVNTGAAGRRPISPLIYGTNEPLRDADRYGSVRLGGNRLTGYNWENNASHAGADYNHQNDSYLCGGLSASDCNLPGRALSQFYQTARSKGQAALLTLPLAGYVAADKSGSTVTVAQTAPSGRWKPVVFRKNAPFTLAPDVNDNAVYVDEEVNYLVQQHGTTASGGVAAYFLDNEPGLWAENHSRLHPAAATMQEVVTKSHDAALAVKAVDPSAQIYGGVLYGFSDYFSLQNAPDYGSQIGGYAWFVDYYLDRLRQASNTAGLRLLDALDVHYYPEAVGTNRVCLTTANTALDRQARLQAPRTLWQPGYQENSWIANEPWFLTNYLPIIPRLQQSIDAYYPDTKLSISEYAFGGDDDISGGIAQADVLGIFGKYGVHHASWWKMYNPGSTATYISPAFQLYTNYDGAGSTFGSTAVAATTSDIPNTSVYAAISGSDERRLTLVVLNKASQPVQGSFTLASGTAYVAGAAWGFDQSGPSVVSRPAVTGLAGNQFTYTLPALSATTIVLTAAGPLPVTLSAFDGQEVGGQPLLRWTTASEQDADYFEVQRRGEGEASFQPLGRVPATNGSTPRQYTFRDAAPRPGTNHYRLRLVDRDGSATTSAIVSVHRTAGADPTLTAFPNPLPPGEALQVQLPAADGASRQLRVRNALGQVKLLRELEAGTTRVSLPEAVAWPAGVYVVEVSGPHGLLQRQQLMRQ
ncbi:glycoside hydrolase family 44 protein [Hymenobacter sp. B81]|uniref:glycoside hydrolase family 44 protein n=1 Tax=Hymenobacter sp. B81 TaxID=3344878 RepID=UPI0037DC022F